MSEDGGNLVPTSRGSSPAPVSRETRLARTARGSAVRSLGISSLAFGHLPLSLPAIAAPLFATLYGAGASLEATLAIGNGLLLLMGGAMTWGAAKLMVPSIRAAALRSREEGHAAAAGASLSLAGFLTSMIVATHAYILLTYGTPWLWLGTLRMVVASLTVGLFGSMLFREVEKTAGNENPRLPRLYRGLAAAAVPVVGGHFLMGLGGFSPFGPAGVLMLIVGAMVGWAATHEQAAALDADAGIAGELPEH